MARQPKPKSDPPLRCFTYSSPDVPGSYARVHGRYPKTKKDRDALDAIIKAANAMLAAKKE